MKSIFYIVYNNDAKQLPAYLATSIDELQAWTRLSRGSLFNALKHGIPVTDQPSGSSYIIKRWNNDALQFIDGEDQ